MSSGNNLGLGPRPFTVYVTSAATGAVAALAIVGGGLWVNQALTGTTPPTTPPTHDVVIPENLPLPPPPRAPVPSTVPDPSTVPLCIKNPVIICDLFV